VLAQRSPDGRTVVAHGRTARWRRSPNIAASGGGKSTRSADLAEIRQVDRLADTSCDATTPTRAGQQRSAASAAHGERELSVDGIELRFAVNHLAGYALPSAWRSLAGCAARIVRCLRRPARLDPRIVTAVAYDGITPTPLQARPDHATYDLAADLVAPCHVNALHPASFMNTAMVREYGHGPSARRRRLQAVLRLSPTRRSTESVSLLQRIHSAQPDRKPMTPLPRLASIVFWTVSATARARAAVGKRSPSSLKFAPALQPPRRAP